MREIKFRAWDERLSEWLGTNFRIDPDGGVRVQVPIKEEPYKLEYVSFNGPLKVMQYTGLKDKNGVEIYEGDIVTVKGPAALFTETGTVMWRPKATGYEVRAVNPYYANKFISRSLYNAEVEVIGNIYENPELLK